MALRRGDIVVVASKGPYTGKPRPALIVQSDFFNSTHASVSVCLITSDCNDAPLFRVTLPPGPRTGLSVPSQVMVDKVISLPRGSVGRTVGACDADEMDAVATALRRWFELE